tara:strand:+ start:3191 stop:4114 length:924 start_codon:yes stop_codon:yes gene_type:complete
MRIIKPSFWERKNFLAYLLSPLSLFAYLNYLIKKLTSKQKFSIKTICIGNIYVGGTGKTSLVIKINELLRKKFKTVFIKKKYTEQSDEINLLRTKGNLISKKERKEALLKAEKEKFQVALLDDGLQQKNIHYDLKIVCFNSEAALGNNFLLPAGPLRESMNEIKNYDFAFLNGEKKNKKLYSKLKSINKKINIFEGKYTPINLSSFDLSKNYLMFCGIGNPEEFENTLKKYKFKIKEKLIFPDHYRFSTSEINKFKLIANKKKLCLVTTEKDFLRLRKSEKKNIMHLKVELTINKIDVFKKAIIKKL